MTTVQAEKKGTDRGPVRRPQDAGRPATAAEAIERLLAAQIELRNSRCLAVAMRSSRLPCVQTLESLDFGPPGVGKTHLAISLAIAAAESGRRVYYGSRSSPTRSRRPRPPDA